jgi:hypothetical protein
MSREDVADEAWNRVLRFADMHVDWWLARLDAFQQLVQPREWRNGKGIKAGHRQIASRKIEMQV